MPGTGGSDGDGDRVRGPGRGPGPGPGPQRVVTRQMMKAQFDVKQKVQDALDTARAAELALREMISSWRAAK